MTRSTCCHTALFRPGLCNRPMCGGALHYPPSCILASWQDVDQGRSDAILGCWSGDSGVVLCDSGVVSCDGGVVSGDSAFAPKAGKSLGRLSQRHNASP